MSWIVNKLINEDVKIRKRYLEETSDSTLEDEFLGVISVEQKVKELYQNNRLSTLEFRVVNMKMEGYSVNAIADELNLSRTTVYNIIAVVSNRVAFHLGGIYTDEGYVNYLKNKYNLDEEQLNRLNQIIKKRKGI